MYLAKDLPGSSKERAEEDVGDVVINNKVGDKAANEDGVEKRSVEVVNKVINEEGDAKEGVTAKIKREWQGG